MELKEIRNKYEQMATQWEDSRTHLMTQIIGDLISYLEHYKPPYVPEPRLGPQPESEDDAAERERVVAQIVKGAEEALAAERQADHKGQTLCTTSGKPITDETREINQATGMQNDYIVLCADERAKGFVRPFRDRYRHVGQRPKYPVRDLTEEERERYTNCGYVQFEVYPESESPKTGRFWTQEELDREPCGEVTTMAHAIAETLARDPSFYSGGFCATCRTHFPNAELQWLDGQIVGS